MSFFPDAKTFLEIGPFTIAWYAITMMGGIGVCAAFAWRQLKRNGYDFSLVEDLIIGCLLFGFIGARLWFCAFYNLDYFLANPLDILKIYEGGLAIQGGLVAGGAYGFYYAYKRKISFLRAADAIVPCMLIAQTIGRWGNFINQEAFGKIVDASYYQGWPVFISNGMFIDGAYREPTFLYESIGNLIGFILIWFIYRNSKLRKRGDLTYAYLIWYGIIRFFVEGLRTDSLMFGPIRMAQLTSIVFIVIGALGIVGVYNKFMKPKKPVVLFDLDGTLLDTEKAIQETYRHLFIKYKTEEEFNEEVKTFVLGPTLKESFEKYFPERDVEMLINEYRVINKEVHPEMVTAMKNAQSTVQYLYDNGYTLGIVSSKINSTIRLGLSLFDMEKYFDVIIGLDDVEREKPNKEGIVKACTLLNRGIDECIYVGDSVSDIKAAKHAGVFSIGYIFNEKRKEALVQSKPNKVIDDLKDITEIVKENHSWTYNMM